MGILQAEVEKEADENKKEKRSIIIEKIAAACGCFVVAVAKEGIDIAFGHKPDRKKADSILLLIMESMKSLNRYCDDYGLDHMFKEVSADSAVRFAREMHQEIIDNSNEM
ncbi:MAG: hypothetical protein ABFD08_19055 [Syntrophomonas sp.]